MKHVLAFLAALLALVPITDAGEAPRRPNVLLICVDDLKPALGCYGDKVARTPNVDRLAARGVLFERAYCNQAVCSPSRNALMLGLRPQTLGIYDLSTNFRKSVPDAVTLAQHFRAAGYRTEAMGKIFHVGHGNTEDEASWTVPHFKHGGRMYAVPANRPPAREAGDKRPAEQRPRGTAFESAPDADDDVYADGRIAAEAVRRLEGAKSKPEEPFFIAVGFIKPHLPFCAPKKYWDLYDRDALPTPAVTTPPEGAPSYAPQFGGELRQYKGIPKQGALPADLQRTLVHGYYAATSYMDAQLGRVLDALDQTGLAANTIVVLWGDHGWHLGDHGIWCKHTNYEQAARVPLIISAPGMTTAGSRSNALIETVDLYPTLAQLAGLPPRGKIDGQSFVNTLKDSKAAHRTWVTHVYPRGQRIGRAIRTDRYRLVEWKVPGEPAEKAELELYDYQADPEERRNLAAEQKDVVAELRAILAKHPEARPQLKPPTTAPAK